jgi:Kdo2-lipid IVA lauroyltransferase/acyltransferase
LARKKSWLQIHAEHAIAGSLLYALRRLPLPAANALARASVRLLDIAVSRLRSVGRKNLSFAFPELDTHQRDQILNGVFSSIARLLVAVARFPDLDASNISQWISYEGFENYECAKHEGRGVLVATAHLGNWELSAFAHALLTEPMNIIVRPLDNPLIDRIIGRRRTLSGNSPIDKRDAARAVIRALKNNEAVGILIDQNTAQSEGVFVNFFNKPACAGSGFVKLAYHTGAPVIPGFALWNSKIERYVLHFYPRIALTGDVQADTQRIHSLVEDIIREYPDQWMWIHRRWKTRPPGEDQLY